MLLLTGFEPFDGSPTNPSEQTAHALQGQTIAGLPVVSAILPVDWQRGPAALLAALEQHRPRAVLCLGEASGRAALSVERVAINLLDFRIPDNSGVTLVDRPVVPGGPDAYFSSLPVREIIRQVQAAGVPVELSLSAGTYLCNQVFYTLMHWRAHHPAAIPAGFIHLPRLPEQAAAMPRPAPSMSLDTILVGVRAAITAVQSALEPAAAEGAAAPVDAAAGSD